MRSRLSRALFLAAALVLAAGMPAAAVESSPYGVNIHLPQGAELEQILNRARDAGIGWVRIDFVWAYVETSRDHFDWTVYDNLAAEARERGIEIFASLVYSPDWATGGPALIGVPDDPAEWADFCERAARRYRGTIRHWGLWNEPNLPHFWDGTRQQYIDLILKPGAAAIRAGNPDALVGGPDLAHLTAGDADWYDWLREVLLEAGDDLDFVTHHAYDEDGPRDLTEKLEGSTLFGNRPQFWDTVTPTVEEVLKNAGWWGKPFWLTETGWESAEVTEANQAAYLRGFLEEWFTGKPEQSWIDKIFVYEMKDGPSPSSPSWGILRPNGNPKPAWTAYRDFTAAHATGDPLTLFGGRFDVEVTWRTRDGASGYGHPIADSDNSGFFWFFGPENIELVVKLLDGRPVNGHFWFFYGALSDVEYWITVTDKTTGAIRQYHNPQGNLCGSGDTKAFPDSGDTVAAPLQAEPLLQTDALTACTGDPDSLCLLDSRFRVEVEFRDPRNGAIGKGTAIPRTDQSGTFWFFGPANIELVVKVLDARPVNGKFWVFYGALSDVEYRITVTDTETGMFKQYHNRKGNLCGLGDTEALGAL